MLNTILISLGILLAVVLLLIGGFLAYRYFAPRHTPKIKGEHAIAELFSIPVNGVKQWLLMRGVDRRKPVLLFLHGGPGSAHIGILRHYQQELEKHFVVIQWDQRGAGLSGNEPVPDETYTKEQFVADGLEVTKYLRERFQQDKIFLVGHSWGSALGYMLAVRHPEYYQAFAGLGQMSKDNETLAYQETLRLAQSANNQTAVKELEQLGAPPYTHIPDAKGTLHKVDDGNVSLAGMLVRFKWSEVLGGDAKYIKVSDLVARELLLSTEYTFQDAMNWLKNKGRSINLTYNECNRDIDLYKEGTEFKIPVFFLLGKWDLLTVPSGAVALMETIHAPQKEIIWFDSGHEIHWERPREYQKVLIEKLKRFQEQR
jgi:pimeloyl-ACP methyl ester carboxylesterase